MPLRGANGDENRARPPVRARVLSGAVSPQLRLAPGLLAPTTVASSTSVRFRHAEAPRAVSPVGPHEGRPRSGRARGPVRGSGRAQGHSDGGGPPADRGWVEA